MRYIITFTLLATFSIYSNAEQTLWKGLIVEPENRCSSYDKSEQYPYPQSVEDEIVSIMGGLVYGPYTGRYFDNDRETDIEHIVAASEGHDSGLCKEPISKRIQFESNTIIDELIFFYYSILTNNKQLNKQNTRNTKK